MLTSIKALETKYDGIMFRSRIEARWACLFKSLRLRYIYEPERFVMYYASKKYVYMPDFYMIDLNCYVEVKGKEPIPMEQAKAWVLSKTSGCLVHVVYGQIPYPHIDEWNRFNFGIWTYDASLTRYAAHLQTTYALNSCIKCGRIEFVPNGDRTLISCSCEKRHTSNPTKRIAVAFGNARMERFDRRRNGDR